MGTYFVISEYIVLFDDRSGLYAVLQMYRDKGHVDLQMPSLQRQSFSGPHVQARYLVLRLSQIRGIYVPVVPTSASTFETMYIDIVVIGSTDLESSVIIDIGLTFDPKFALNLHPPTRGSLLYDIAISILPST